MKKILTYLVAAVLVGFGLITLFLSSSLLFDWFGIRAKEGNYVILVVIANLIASVIYLMAAYGFLKGKIFTAKLLYVAVAVLIAAFAGLFVHINMNGIYETKTIFALVFRITLTFIFAIAAHYLIPDNQKVKS